MKLYTESQVKDMFLEWATTNKSRDDIMRDFTPIELPTNEEIDDYAMTEAKIKEADSNDTTIGLLAYVGFKIGAKWVIEHIEKQKFGISE